VSYHGLGMVSRLAVASSTWSGFWPAERRRRVENSRSTTFLQDRLPIPRGDGSDGTFNPEAVDGAEGTAQGRPFILYGIAAADEALKDAGWQPEDRRRADATGVLIGSGIGGLEGIVEAALYAARQGPAPHQPLLHSRRLINLVSGQVSIRHGSKARTTRSSPPARPARMPSATLPADRASAMPTSWWPAAPNRP
jgi:3-oxoacyl-(acyl-carrier-protein) synthase